MRQTRTKIFSWLLTLVMAFSLLSPCSVWKARAEGAYDGYVYVTVERLTLGQGLADEPVKLGYYEGDSLEDILKRNAEGKMSFTDSGWGAYLSGYTDGGEPEGWTRNEIPEKIRIKLGEDLSESSKRQESGILAENDYVNYSGFTVAVDNVFCNTGISEIDYNADNEADTYHNGSVVRIQFSLTYGDLNITPSEYGSPMLEFADKDNLIKKTVDYSGKKENSAYEAAVSVIEDWDAAQAEVDAALAALIKASYSDSYKEKHRQVVQYLKTQAEEPSYGDEWIVLALARSGLTEPVWYKAYKESVQNTLKEKESNVLSASKSTENARVIIALTAIGADASKLTGYDLTAPLADFDYVKRQGLNGLVYALIALDCGRYEIPEAGEGVTQTTRDLLISSILEKAVENGGWTFSGTTADPDMTGMTIQALAPYYNSDEQVKTAVDKALIALSGMQKEDGGYASWGTVNSASCAQVLCAISALGIDAEADSRFIKNGSSVLDAMLSFHDESTGGFQYVAGGSVNGMAGNQAAYALAAYLRLKNNRNSLYDMSDADCFYQCAESTHNWDAGKVTKETAYDAEGEMTYTCTVCGVTKTVSIPKKEQPPITQPPITEQPAPQQVTTEQKSNAKPAKTTISKVKSPKKKQIKVTWKRKSGITGYQIQLSTSSKFKKAKTYRISGQKSTGKTIKSLKSKKKYYVRVRTYKTTKVKEKKVNRYSSWSAKKTVKVK